jgi:hypothetical protein
MTNDTKPKMLMGIEHLDAAISHLNSSMNVFSSVIHDLQRGADYLLRYRDSLVKTIEDSGGDATQAIESQIREFIPKRLRDGKDQESQGGQNNSLSEPSQRK